MSHPGRGHERAAEHGRGVPVRVVIAEDHLLIREGLQRILEDCDDIDLVGVVADDKELIQAVELHQPHVVVIDCRTPTDSTAGIHIANRLRAQPSGIAVLALSQHADPACAMALFRDGASGRGYLLESRLGDPRELLAAVFALAEGGAIVDPLVVDALVSSRSRAQSSPLHSLTARESEVLAEVAAGKSNAAIARSLVITRRSVEHHITSIFAKLELPDETEVSRRVRAALLYLADHETE